MPDVIDKFDKLDMPGHLLVPRKRAGMSLPSMSASRRPSRATISVKIDAEVASRFRELCYLHSGHPSFLRQNVVL